MGHGYADYLQDFASLTETPKTVRAEPGSSIILVEYATQLVAI